MRNTLNRPAAHAQQLFNAGRKKEALEQIIKLRKKYPREYVLKEMLAFFICECGKDVPTSGGFARELLICLDENLADPRRLMVAAGPVLFADSAFIGVVSMVATGNLDTNRSALNKGWLRPVFENDLFLGLMRNVLLTNREYELALTRLRKLILHSLMDDGGTFSLPRDVGTAFCSALARQCLLNEFIFFVDQNERSLVLRLHEETTKRLAGSPEVDERQEAALLTLSMYMPLQQLNMTPNRWDLNENHWPQSLRPIILEISNYRKEQKIKQEIQTIGTVENKVSILVKEQYEDNPYPRWSSLPCAGKTSFCDWMSSNFPHFKSPEFLKSPVRLLLAGCGTGRELVWLQSIWNTSHILAIDLSRSSLAYAIRKVRERSVDSAIDFRQADILGITELSDPYQEFDVICCSGVLHHMEDPMQGWQILVDKLRPGGIIKAGLYSELARRLVIEARQRIVDENISPTPENIRNFRHAIFSGCYPELVGLNKNSDMFSMSNCRDLLFHIQEWRFTIEKIKKGLEQLNLRFIGFEGIDIWKRKYAQMFPEDRYMDNLDNWAVFERGHPDTFESMYNIVAQKQ